MRHARLGWSRLLGLVLPSLALLGCAGASEPPEFPQPARRAPSEYLPGDLDVVVRLDLERMRQSLPPGSAEALVTRGQKADDPASATLSSALAVAQRVWIGFRPGTDFDVLDSVLVLEGNFAGAPSQARLSAFWPGRDLGAGLAVFEAKEKGARSAPARLYAWAEEIWVVASIAEIDAVERTVEIRANEMGLAPPSRGVFSAALRIAPFMAQLRERSPRAAAVLEGAQRLELSSDVLPEGFRIRAELIFTTQEQAERAGRALGLLFELLGTGAASAGEGKDPLSVQIVRETAVVEGVLSPEQLGAWTGQR